MQSPEGQLSRWTWRSILSCAFFSVGIVVNLLIYGLWQEKIMSRPYHTGFNFGEYLSAFSDLTLSLKDPNAWPTDLDYFESSLMLVLVSRIFGLIFALVMMISMREPFGLQASVFQYMLISMSTVVASTCQFEALKYVTFTLQILGKSFKMFPMMLWGFLILKKSYRTLDWTVALFFTGGVIAYLVGGGIAPEHTVGTVWWGIGLLASFIVLDALTSWHQDRLFAESGNSKYNQMLYINAFSAVLAVVIIFIRGEWRETFTFCQEHPTVAVDASIMSVSAVLAQWFVYAQMHSFGTMAFVVTMNLRQILSVVASIIVYHHSVTHLQTAALAVCCWSLLWQVLGGNWPSTGERAPLLKDVNDKVGPTDGHASVLPKPTQMAQCCVPCVGRDRSGQV